MFAGRKVKVNPGTENKYQKEGPENNCLSQNLVPATLS